MFDLDRDVVRHRRELSRQTFDDGQCVGRPVEEVGIAEGDVLGAGCDLGGDVRQHDVYWHGAEPPVVNRDDRAMPAAMFAATRRLGIPDEAAGAVDVQAGVGAERRQVAPIRLDECQPW